MNFLEQNLFQKGIPPILLTKATSKLELMLDLSMKQQTKRQRFQLKKKRKKTQNFRKKDLLKLEITKEKTLFSIFKITHPMEKLQLMKK